MRDTGPVMGVPPRSHYAVYFISERNYFFHRHTHHDFCDLMLVQSGTVRHELNAAEYQLQVGDLELVRQGDTHQLSGSNVKMISMAFPQAIIEGLIADDEAVARRSSYRRLVEAKRLHAHIPKAERPRLVAMMRQLLLARETAYGLAVFRRLFYEILLDYLMPAVPKTITDRTLPDWLVSCLDRLDREPERNWTLDDITRLCGRCREHVIRSFRRYLDRTPSEILNDHRLNQAERLLSFTTMQITDVARESGFQNLSYFNRLFHKRHRMPPRKYREQNRSFLPA